MRKISSLQGIVLIFFVQIGIGVLTLPSVVSGAAHNLSWISIILMGIWIQLIIFLFVFALKGAKEDNFFAYFERLAGRWITKAVILILSLYFLAVSGFVLRSYVDLLNIWAFQTTPPWVLLSILTVTILYLASSRLESIARICEFFIIPLIGLFLILLTHIPDFDMEYLKPQKDMSVRPILQGSLKSSWSFVGFELGLVFFFLLQKRTRLLRVLTISNWLTVICFLYITMLSLLIFTPEILSRILWPTLSLYKLLEFRFIQRLEYIVVMVWVPMVTIVTGLYLWSAAKGLEYLNIIKDKKKVHWIGLLVLLIAFIPKNYYQTFKFSEYTGYIGMILAMLLPIFMICMRLLKQKKGGSTG